MPKELRMQRLADLIRTTLATVLLQDDDNQGFNQVIIHKVILAKDLAIAKVYVSFVLAVDPATITLALNQAAKSLRYKLAQQCMLRTTPALKFYYDDSSIQGLKISNLLKQVSEG
jgi:ribosome-binding factor A